MNEAHAARAAAGGPSGCESLGRASMRHVALIGMMGSGKSVVGLELAARLGRPFFDCDSVVAAEAGKSVPDIFASDGETVFRRLESDALKGLLGGVTPAVISTGGGVVLCEDNRALLTAKAYVVWLRAKAETLARRVGSASGRPLLECRSDPPGSEARSLQDRLASLSAEREARYREISDVSLETDDVFTDAVVDALCVHVKPDAGGSPEMADWR